MRKKSRRRKGSLPPVAFSFLSLFNPFWIHPPRLRHPFEPALCTTGCGLWIYVEEKFIRKLDNARTELSPAFKSSPDLSIPLFCIYAFVLELRRKNLNLIINRKWSIIQFSFASLKNGMQNIKEILFKKNRKKVWEDTNT